MDVGGEDKSDLQEDLMVEEDSMDDLIRDRFRLSAISIAEAEAKKNGMDIAGPVVACLSDLAFRYTENLAKDLELFAHHAGRKVVNMDDVVLSAHKNDHLAASLRSLCNELKSKEPQSERKRKKGSAKKDDKASKFALVTMAPSDSSPTKPEDGSGNGKSHHEIGAVVIQQQIDEVESDKNAEPSHDAGSFYEPGPYTLCCGPEDYDNYFDNPPWECEPSFNPPSEEDEDMYAEEEDEYNTYYCHVNNGGSLKEVCDENGHVDGGNNGEAESTRVIYVPSPKVGLVVGAVATLKYLQSNFGDRIRILRDSEVDMKRAQTPVVITGTNSQIEFVEQLIDAVLVEENHEERMEEETEKPSSQKDCDARSDEVLAEQTHL